MTAIVAGLDLSLTSTGIALVNPHGGHVVHRVKSTGGVTATLAERAARLAELVARITGPTEGVAGADLLIVEGPSFGQARQGGQHDRAGLWWLVVARLHAMRIPVAEVAPSARAKYATGAGNAGKDAVLAAAVKRYPDWDITGNDVADAVILAAMGARHLGTPIDSLPQIHLSAMTKVRWPATESEASA